MAETATSILDSIKKKLGLEADYDVFDLDVMTHINSAFMNLHQLGIGPAEGFFIEDAEAAWDTFLGAQHSPLLNSARTYVYFKVKLAFDPPPMSFHVASIEKQIVELEWRMTLAREELIDATIGLVVPGIPLDESEEIDGGGAEGT